MSKILLLIRNENSDYANEMYIKAIQEFLGSVVLIYDKSSKSEVLSKLRGVDGILLPGGDDVGVWDYFLIDYALKHHLRLLGICQGMQSMAMFGSKDSLVSIGNDSHKQSEGYIHSVYLEDGVLRRLLGKCVIRVNSHHRQTVLCSHKFIVTGMSDDELIEVVEGVGNIFQVGVQWHPERMLDYDKDSRVLLEKFVRGI